jgi:hypothetical protein
MYTVFRIHGRYTVTRLNTVSSYHEKPSFSGGGWGLGRQGRLVVASKFRSMLLPHPNCWPQKVGFWVVDSDGEGFNLGQWGWLDSKQIINCLPCPHPSSLQEEGSLGCGLPQSRLCVSFLPSPPEGNQRQASAVSLKIPGAFSTMADRKEVLPLISL